MGRVHQPLLLLATFLIAFSSLIEGQKTSLGQFDLQKVRPESEGIIKGRYVDNPFNSVYYPDSGVGFRDKGSSKDGSTRVNGEEPALFLMRFLPGLGYPFPFPFPFPGLGFPNPFPFPFPRGGWPWGGFPGGPGTSLGRRGGFGFPGGPGGFLGKHEAEGKDEFRRNPSP